MIKSSSLGGGRRARSDIAENHERNGGHEAEDFQPAGNGHQGHGQRNSDDGSSNRRTDWAGVGIHRSWVEVHAAMQLRREEKGPEE